MEKKVKRKAKENKCTLPTLHDPKQSRSLLLTKKSQLQVSTERFKDLRKLYFQYKSNANILSNSPYYSNRHQQKEVIAFINKNKYDLPNETKEDIQKRITSDYPNINKYEGLEYRIVKIKVEMERTWFDCVLEARSVEEMQMKLRMEYAFNEYRKAESIIGFQSIAGDSNIDFQLSQKERPVFLAEMQLKPIFYLQIKARVRLNHFQLVRCLGTGGFSLVYLVRNNWNGQFYALKLISKEFILTSERQSIVQNERYVLGELKSQFVTRLKFCFQTKNHFAFMIEYCPGGELFYQLKKVKKMTEEQAKFYFLEILIGLDYLHEKKIIYRDLKPENLMIAIDGHIKIADFGLAKPFLEQERTKAYSFCGSPQYMAPEMLLKDGHNNTLDYYCLGALLYELVLGIPPFYSLNQDQIYRDILKEQITFPEHTQLSNEIKSLIRGLLQKNPSKRLGHLYGIKEILIHPWIGRVNKKNIEEKKLIPPFLPDLSNFNFDEEDIKDKTIQNSQAIQEDLKNLKFDTHFNQEFYYQQPNIVKRQTKEKKYKISLQNKRKSNIKEQRAHFSVDSKPKDSQVESYPKRIPQECE